MGSVYRKAVTKPLPGDAEIITRKGEKLARWRDTKGKTRTAPLTDAGDPWSDGLPRNPSGAGRLDRATPTGPHSSPSPIGVPTPVSAGFRPIPSRGCRRPTRRPTAAASVEP